MKIIINRKHILFSGVLLALLGILNSINFVEILIFIVKFPKISASFNRDLFLKDFIPLYQLDIAFFTFFSITILIAIFGVLRYKKWARKLTIIVTCISFPYHFYFLIIGIRDYFLPTSIETKNGFMEINYANYPRTDMFFQIVIMLCLVYILIVMLHKDTKLIFDRNVVTK